MTIQPERISPLTMAMFQLFVVFPQLVFGPFTLFAITGAFQAGAKFVVSGFKVLASLPVPVLRGWGDNDARYLNLNSGTLGMDRC
jgi:hypothetical protein